jgi:hypothetical protein
MATEDVGPNMETDGDEPFVFPGASAAAPPTRKRKADLGDSDDSDDSDDGDEANGDAPPASQAAAGGDSDDDSDIEAVPVTTPSAAQPNGEKAPRVKKLAAKKAPAKTGPEETLKEIMAAQPSNTSISLRHDVHESRMYKAGTLVKVRIGGVVVDGIVLQPPRKPTLATVTCTSSSNGRMGGPVSAPEKEPATVGTVLIHGDQSVGNMVHTDATYRVVIRLSGHELPHGYAGSLTTCAVQLAHPERSVDGKPVLCAVAYLKSHVDFYRSSVAARASALRAAKPKPKAPKVAAGDGTPTPLPHPKKSSKPPTPPIRVLKFVKTFAAHMVDASLRSPVEFDHVLSNGLANTLALLLIALDRDKSGEQAVANFAALNAATASIVNNQTTSAPADIYDAITGFLAAE